MRPRDSRTFTDAPRRDSKRSPDAKRETIRRKRARTGKRFTAGAGFNGVLNGR